MGGGSLKLMMIFTIQADAHYFTSLECKIDFSLHVYYPLNNTALLLPKLESVISMQEGK